MWQISNGRLNVSVMRILTLVVLTALTASLMVSPASADESDLDITNFGAPNGYVILDLGGTAENVTDIALQPDGKIVVTGRTNALHSSFDIYVARFNSDGSVDASFGTSTGFSIVNVSSASEASYGVIVMPDDRIVVAGVYGNVLAGGSGHYMVAFNSDGTLDPNFGSQGYQITALPASSEAALDLALQEDGQIVTAGQYYNGGTSLNTLVTRHNPDGSLDPSFNGVGYRVQDMGLNSSDWPYAVEVAHDGSIITGGTRLQSHYAPEDNDFTVASFSPSGGLNWRRTVNLGSGRADSILGLAIQPDNKIVAVGRWMSGYSTTSRSFATFRFNPDGSLDTTFSGNGYDIHAFNSRINDAYNAMILADGRILVSGHTEVSSGIYDPAFIMYDASGNPDLNFNGDGFLIVDLPDTTAATAAVMQPDGKILFAGSHGVGGVYDILIGRMIGTGSATTPSTHSVCASGCDFATIQAAVDAANPGDTLDIAAETFIENVFSDKDLTLQGAGPGATIVDGNGTGPVFRFSGNPTITMTGMTIQNGNYVLGGGLALELVDFTGQDLEIKDNVSNGQGGGIYVSGSTLHLSSSVISGNEVTVNGVGGGIRVSAAGIAELSNLQVIDNTTGGSGAGIYNSGELTITDSSISSNHANGGGGGVFNIRDSSPLVGLLIIRGTTISDNLGAGLGGGLVNVNGAELDMANSTISGNETNPGGSNDGGGIYMSGSGTLANLNNVTVTENVAGGNFGGIANYGGTLNVSNSIVAGNFSTGYGPDCGWQFDTSSHNLVGDNTNCNLVGSTADIYGVAALLGPLQDNGGTTETHALIAGSPAIDAGDNGTCEIVDQRGETRPVSAACDIGAFEGEVANQVPVSDPGGPYQVDEGGQVQLDGSASYDPEDNSLTYEWDLNNDGSFETTGIAPVFDASNLDGPSSYTIWLEVCDQWGCSTPADTTVEVLNVAPTAEFSVQPTLEFVGNPVMASFSAQDDAGVDDSVAGFSYSYDCENDGTFEADRISASSYACAYESNGSKMIVGRIFDKDDEYTTFNVTVEIQSAQDAVSDVFAFVEGLDLPPGIANSLLSSLQSAVDKLEDDNPENDVAATNKLEAFVHEVEAQSGKKIDADDAQLMIDAVRSIVDYLTSN